MKFRTLPGVGSPGLLEKTVFFDLTDSFDDSDYVSASCKPQLDSSGGEFSGAGNSGHQPMAFLKPEEIPPHPFNTPEKLQPVEYVYKGRDVATLRLLAVGLLFSVVRK